MIGQSSKPLGVVLPPKVLGNVSDSRKQILLNTLDEEISKYFDVSPSTNDGSGNLPVVSDVFQLQIVEEDGDTQLSVRWMSGNERKVETILCGGCKTIELNGKLEELVEKLIGSKKEEPVVVERPVVEVEKGRKGILFLIGSHGERVWNEDGDKKKFGKYVGEIALGKPNGFGIYENSKGDRYEGEWRGGRWHGQGIYSYPDERKVVGEFRGGKDWNTKEYDKDGNIIGKWVNGKQQ